MIRIILVEDNIALRTELVNSLRDEGLDAVGVGGSTELFFALLHTHTDIVIMDIGLSGENGISIVQQLKSISLTQSLGIIMLTAQTGRNYRLESLSSGADAYLIKPVEIDELTAYIHNLYRRMHAQSELHSSSRWQFCYSDWRLLCPSGAIVDLSHLETKFIEILVEHAGKPVRRKDIIAIAFMQDPVAYDNRRLEAVVSRLRRKIHNHYPMSHPIKAVHSIGYVFTDPVFTV